MSTRTPLHALHLQRGARMTSFAGFELPLVFDSILAEHRAVRSGAGLFDVSHMGQLHVRGPGAVATLENLLSCPVASLSPGRVRYGLLCNEAGGVLDDLTLYRLADDHFFLCVNAANIEKDLRWCSAHCKADTQIEDRSAETALIAVQGPSSAALLRRVMEEDPAALRRFRVREARAGGAALLVSRTGYTGSDGFELYMKNEAAAPLWRALLDAGATPCGLGARDTLRIEAALPLYGHELDEETTPLEAGLERFTKLDAGGFIGAAALAEQARRGGPARRLCGFTLRGRSIARAGQALFCAGRRCGVVTSGAPGSELGKSIGLGYLAAEFAKPGRELEVEIRGRRVAARVAATPFVPAGGAAAPTLNKTGNEA